MRPEKEKACTDVVCPSLGWVGARCRQDSSREHLRGQDYHSATAICSVSKLTAPGHVLSTSDTNDSDLMPVTQELIWWGRLRNSRLEPVVFQDRKVTKGL